jgi:hypothetical protein
MVQHHDTPPPRTARPTLAQRIYRGLWVVCAIAAAADLFYHKHISYRIEEFPAFYGILAFIVCIGLATLAREAGNILKRDEDYYDR